MLTLLWAVPALLALCWLLWWLICHGDFILGLVFGGDVLDAIGKVLAAIAGVFTGGDS